MIPTFPHSGLPSANVLHDADACAAPAAALLAKGSLSAVVSKAAPPASAGAPPHGLVRLSVLAALPDFARSYGLDLDRLCERAGESAAVLADADAFFTYQRFGRVLEAARATTGCGHVGLLLGDGTTLSCLGLLGLLMKYAASPRAALDLFARHIRLHDRVGVVTISVEAGQACVHYAVNRADPATLPDIVDHSIAMLHRLLQEICGAGWRADEVLLARRRPLDPAPYRRFFRALVRFDAEASGIVFPARWLDEVNTLSEPGLLRILEERAQELQKDDDVRFSDLVRRAIRPLLSSQKCSAVAAAEAFRIGKRTLNRRLSEEGTDFRTLIDEVRFDVARHLLGSTEISLSDIALALGYSEASTFTRAFRRWSGRSPREWRITSRSPAGPARSSPVSVSARSREPTTRTASAR